MSKQLVRVAPDGANQVGRHNKRNRKVTCLPIRRAFGKRISINKRRFVCCGGFRVGLGWVRGQSAWGYPSLPSATLTGRFLVRYQLGLGIQRGAKQEPTEMCQVILTSVIHQLLTAARFCAIFPGIQSISCLIPRYHSKKIEYFPKNSEFRQKKCDFFYDFT